ncbi:MAG TPA: hypothetical protein VF940_15345 [Streptosporangiaceae bacterium]
MMKPSTAEVGVPHKLVRAGRSGTGSARFALAILLAGQAVPMAEALNDQYMNEWR